MKKKTKLFSIIFTIFFSLVNVYFVVITVVNNIELYYRYTFKSPAEYGYRTIAVLKNGIEKSNIYASDIEITEKGKSTNYFDLYHLDMYKSPIDENGKKIKLSNLPDEMTYEINSVRHLDSAGWAVILITIKYKNKNKDQWTAKFHVNIEGLRKKAGHWGEKKYKNPDNNKSE